MSFLHILIMARVGSCKRSSGNAWSSMCWWLYMLARLSAIPKKKLPTSFHDVLDSSMSKLIKLAKVCWEMSLLNTSLSVTKRSTRFGFFFPCLRSWTACRRWRRKPMAWQIRRSVHPLTNGVGRYCQFVKLVAQTESVGWNDIETYSK